MTTAEPRAIAFTIHGPIERADLPGLCDRVCALLQRARPEIAYCEVGGIDPDAVTVDALAEGGNAPMPFQKTFFAEGFGMVTDRFGTPWMVSGGMQ